VNWLHTGRRWLLWGPRHLRQGHEFHNWLHTGRRWLLWAFGILFGLQAALIGILMLITRLRRRRVPPGGFSTVSTRPARVDQTEIRLYTEGTSLYEDMLAAIARARHTIHFETYIWKSDEVGERFQQALIERAAAGVQVFIIYDTFANLVVPRRFFRFPPTLHVLPYRAWRRPWHAFDLRRYGRDHRKLLIVDGSVGFVGGYNIGEVYRSEWRDTHMRLTGPEVDDLDHAFVDFWNAHRYPGSPRLPLPARSWSASLRAYRNDPLRLLFPIRSIYIEAIEQAQTHIYMTTAYFIPDDAIRIALVRAAQRGVDVRILVPWQSNHIVADWLARHQFDLCLRGGVRMFGYQQAMIHAKTATIDGIWSMVGTSNLDRLSLAGNYEINVEMFSVDMARTMERIFFHDLENAKEIHLDEWQRRPWYMRSGELLLSPLWPLL
jgi:cardiolipin synthase